MQSNDVNTKVESVLPNKGERVRRPRKRANKATKNAGKKGEEKPLPDPVTDGGRVVQPTSPCYKPTRWAPDYCSDLDRDSDEESKSSRVKGECKESVPPRWQGKNPINGHPQKKDDKAKEKPKPKQTMYPKDMVQDLSSWYNNYAHSLSKYDRVAQALLVKDGVKVRLIDMPTGDHPYSHVCRDEAMRYILAVESRGKKQMVLLDWWGAERNIKFDPSSSVFVLPMVGGTTRDHLKLNVVLAPSDPIGGDASRGRVRDQVTHEADVIVVQDYYYLTPKEVKHLFDAYQQHVWVVVRDFVGEAGAEVYREKIAEGTDKKPAEYGRLVEGVWYREEGQIVFCPDPQAQMYHPHPSLDWLRYRCYEAIDIAHIKRVGPYHLYRLSPTRHGAVPLQPMVNVEPLIATCQLNPYAGLSWAKAILRGKIVTKIQAVFWEHYYTMGTQVVYHNPTVNQYLLYTYKLPTGVVRDTVASFVSSQFQSCSYLIAIGETFPDVYRRIFVGTVEVLLHGLKSERVRSALKLRKFFAEEEQNLYKLRANTPLVPPEVPSWMIAGAVVAAIYPVFKIGLMLRRSYKGIDPEKKMGPVAAFAPMGARMTNDRVVEFFDTCIFAPVAEELLRHFFPRVAAVLLCFFEPLNYLCGFYSNRDAGMHPAMHSFTFHFLMHCIPRTTGFLGIKMGIHFVHNLVASEYILDLMNSPEGEPEWRKIIFPTPEDLAQSYKERSIVQSAVGIIPVVAGFTLPAVNSCLQPLTEKDWRGSGTCSVDGVAASMKNLVLNEVETKLCMYPILYSTAWMYMPANSAYNLLLAVTHRIMKRPPCECPEQEVMKNWMWCQVFLRLFVPVGEEHYDDYLPSLLRSMGSKRKRILDAEERDIEGVTAKLFKTVNVKWNETIASKIVDGVEVFKPRAIVNLDPIYHARTAPWSKQLVKQLKLLWKGSVLHEIPLPSGNVMVVRIIFACGLTHEDLCEVGSFALHSDVITIIVSGDDSLVAWGSYCHLFNARFSAADETMCDQSQGEAALDYWFELWASRCGASWDFIESIKEQNRRNFVARREGMCFVGDPGWELATGLTATTLCNTVHVITKTLYVAARKIEGDERTFDEISCDLGFTSKVKHSDEIEDLEFLKCIFYEADDNCVGALPLPSQVLKLGKSMRDPRQIFTIKTKDGKKVPTIDEAYAMFAASVHDTLKVVPYNYPILGAMVETMHRLGRRPSVTSPEAVVEDWNYKTHWQAKERSVLSPREREVLLAIFIKRYDTSIEEVLSLENLYRDVVSLPVVLHHPLLFKMRSVDYGATRVDIASA